LNDGRSFFSQKLKKCRAIDEVEATGTGFEVGKLRPFIN